MDSYIILVLELIGTVAAAISGALLAIDKGLDLFGVCVLSIITATGGGLIRDIILGTTPPVFFVKPIYFTFSISVALITFFISAKVSIFENQRIYAIYLRAINIFDALGLGVFTVVAMNIAFNAGYADNLFLCIVVSVLTGVGGGMLRDIMVQRTPLVLRQEIYATASIIGGFVYYFSVNILDGTIAALLSIFIIVTIRTLSLYYGIHLPKTNRN